MKGSFYWLHLYRTKLEHFEVLGSAPIKDCHCIFVSKFRLSLILRSNGVKMLPFFFTELSRVLAANS